MRADLVHRLRPMQWFQDERILISARFRDPIDPVGPAGSARHSRWLDYEAIIETRFAGHDEYRMRPAPKGLLFRMFLAPRVVG